MPAARADTASPRPPPHLASFARGSRLRNLVEPESPESEEPDSDGTQSDDAEDGDDNDDDDEEEDDNDWSGENDSLDATVIAAVGGDLVLAAFLIPLLHRDFQSAVRTKVESWQYTAAPGTRDSTSGDGQSSVPQEQQASPSNSRKRRRRASSSGDGIKRDDEDGDSGDAGGGAPGDGGGDDVGRPADPAGDPPRLACPFHKLNPTKYNIQHGGGGQGGQGLPDLCRAWVQKHPKIEVSRIIPRP